jgi:hypothetical protein
VAIPSARAALAAMVKPGVWRNMRAECFRSFRKASITYLDERYHKQSDILEAVRLLVIVASALLTACAPAPRPAEAPTADPTAESWYGQTVEQLAALNRQAESLLRKGPSDEAGAILTEGQPLMNRLLAVPRPTLAAMEAASDLDDLYGRMLLANKQYGWARIQFQKNVARWRSWKPETPETARRRKAAEAGIGECDRHL